MCVRRKKKNITSDDLFIPYKTDCLILPETLTQKKQGDILYIVCMEDGCNMRNCCCKVHADD